MAREHAVAIKYISLTPSYFVSHGSSITAPLKSAGATEDAAACGTPQLIVDVSTTHATLAARGLKVLDDGLLLRNHANLVSSRKADSSGDTLEAARVILDHTRACVRPAQSSKLMTALLKRRFRSRTSCRPLRSTYGSVRCHAVWQRGRADGRA